MTRQQYVHTTSICCYCPDTTVFTVLIWRWLFFNTRLSISHTHTALNICIRLTKRLNKHCTT